MHFIDLQAQHRLIAADLAERFERVHRHGRYVLGPEVEELEERLAGLAGTRDCVTTSSGTDALLLALLTLDLTPGDEIITTPFSFIAPAEVAALLGVRVRFADIDPRTYNLDSTAVAAEIGPRTRAIVAVSLFGQCADFDAIHALAEPRGIRVIEDAAQSLGSSYQGRPAGGLGHIGCTSFYPSKPLSGYGDGGACFTNDPALATRLRALRHHGQTSPYRHQWLGINGRLDTLQAAVLLAKLPLLAPETEARRRLAARYDEALRGLVETPCIEAYNLSVYSCYTIATATRDSLLEHLQRMDIPTARYYAEPLYRQPALAGSILPGHGTPQTESCCRRVLSLPLHPYLLEEEQELVIQGIKAFFAERAVSP